MRARGEHMGGLQQQTETPPPAFRGGPEEPAQLRQKAQSLTPQISKGSLSLLPLLPILLWGLSKSRHRSPAGK